MNPTLKDGEVVFVDRDAEIEVGDIVAAKYLIERTSELIKRVARINEHGHLFSLGDNAEDSSGSRHFGAVVGECIKGKVAARLNE